MTSGGGPQRRKRGAITTQTLPARQSALDAQVPSPRHCDKHTSTSWAESSKWAHDDRHNASRQASLPEGFLGVARAAVLGALTRRVPRLMCPLLASSTSHEGHEHRGATEHDCSSGPGLCRATTAKSHARRARRRPPPVRRRARAAFRPPSWRTLRRGPLPRACRSKRATAAMPRARNGLS